MDFDDDAQLAAFFGWLMTPRGLQGVMEYPHGFPLKGRRLRVLYRIRPLMPHGMKLAEFMANAEALRHLADPYAEMPLRQSFASDMFAAIPVGNARTSNAQVHTGLRDMAYEILEDIQEAAECLGNPDIYYAGVDEGIEPVTDEHVELVMWAMQRELNREERRARTPNGGRLPAVQLATFPWRIQRALAERRRLRYQQWGIGRTEWEMNCWSLWDVPLDPDYESRREARGLLEANDAPRPGSEG